MANEGIYGRNKENSKEVSLYYFVRASNWFYWEGTHTIKQAEGFFKGNPDLSLVAPIVLGRF